MSKNNEQHEAGTNVSRFPEYPWQVMTVFSALVALVCFCAAVWWCFFDTADPVASETRARIVTPFLAFMGAIVTFCAVLWRGTINSRQANEDRRRNEHQQDVNLALLFENAVSMMEDKDSPKYTYALAMLETVAQSQNDLLARNALEQMLDEFTLLYEGFHKHRKSAPRNLQTISRVFDQAGERPLALPQRMIRLGTLSSAALVEPIDSLEIFGSPNMPIRFVFYGNFSIANERSLERMNSLGWIFVGCYFTALYAETVSGKVFEIEIGTNYQGCAFSHMKIASVAESPTPMRQTNTYRACDFSSAIFESPEAFDECLFQGSSYVKASPPKLANGGEFSFEYLSYRGLYSIEAS